MDHFISIIIFSIPGLLAYFWIQSFGLNPTVKHSVTELVAIAALFWAPTVFATIVVFDFLYYITDFVIKIIGWNWSGLGLNLITTVSDIQNEANHLLFILYFIISSVIFSYYVAKVWSINFEKVLRTINKVRRNKGIPILSDSSTTWDSFFLKSFEVDEEGIQKRDRSGNVLEKLIPVKIYKLDNPKEKIYGIVQNSSRPFETERALVLIRSDELKSSDTSYEYETSRSYIDLKTGYVVAELNLEKPTKD